MIKLLIIIMLLAFAPCTVYAITDTLSATFKYTMGDNDTRNDAKRIAFMEAKRRLSERAGVFIESETVVVDSQLSRDEIKSYTTALLKVVVEKEEFQVFGEHQSVTVTVKADVDTEEAARTLSKIKEDRTLQTKIKEQQAAVKELENKINRVQSELAQSDTDKAIQLRKERNIAFQQLSELEKIKFNIQNATKTALQVIERGMSPEEVRTVAGAPRSTAGLYDVEWNYGNVWVLFEGGLVRCLVDAVDYSTHTSCAGYQIYRKRIVK